MLNSLDRVTVMLESTMREPLWARAMYGQLYPEIMSDVTPLNDLLKVSSFVLVKFQAKNNP